MNAGGRYAGAPVLVTGAQGFIGSRLATRLLDAGARVIAPRREGDADARCELVDVDVRDRDGLVRVVEDFGVRAVFHLAARSTTQAARDDPLATFDVNVGGTVALLDACRIAAGGPVERIVVASSHLAPGDAADDPYEVSKAAADAISRSYAATYGLPVAVLRLANVYGCGDLNFTRLVPETARSLVRGERPVLRSNGTPEREFLYVDDAVDAYLAVAESLDDEAMRGRAWSAGSGEPVAVIEVVRRLVAAAGRDLEPLIDEPAAPSDQVDRHAVDASALRDELGWRPRWGLDRGLAETYRWYADRLS